MPFDIDPTQGQDVDEGGEGTAPPTPDPREAELAALRAEKAAAEKRFQDLAMQVVQWQGATPAGPTPSPEKPLPNREEDEDAYIQALVERRVSKALADTITPMTQGLAGDREVVLRNAAAMAKMQAEAQAPEIWREHKADIEAFLAQFPAETIVKPGAIDEAVARVVGMKTLAAQRESTNRPAIAAGQGGSPNTSAPAPRPSFDARTLGMMAREGFTPEFFSDMRESRPYTIDEYQALKAKHEARAKRKS